jgi:putative hydrolase of the HAD superfamily
LSASPKRKIQTVLADPLFTDIRAIAFDAVGTLIFPRPTAAEVYSVVGRRYGSRLLQMEIGPRFTKAFQREEALDRMHDWRTSEERELVRWRRIVGEVLDDVADPEACFQALFDHFSSADAWQCNPEAASTIHTLVEAGYDVSIASNYDRRLRSVLAEMQELRLIRHLVISSEVGWRKPATEFFAAIRAVHCLAAAQILYVGDDPVNDLQAAQAAGMRGVLYSPKETGTAGRINSLSDLLHFSPIR